MTFPQNDGDLKAMGWHIQGAERIELPTKNTISEKTTVQIRRKNKDIFTTIKTKKILWLEICIIRSSEEHSDWKEVTPDSNSNPHKEIESTEKSKYKDNF